MKIQLNDKQMELLQECKMLSQGSPFYSSKDEKIVENSLIVLKWHLEEISKLREEDY